MADAVAITRINECAEPFPPRLHLLPPWLPPPLSIWQIPPPSLSSPPPSPPFTPPAPFLGDKHIDRLYIHCNRFHTFTVTVCSKKCLNIGQEEAQLSVTSATQVLRSDWSSQQPKPSLAPTGVAVTLILRLSTLTLLRMICYIFFWNFAMHSY